jgi:hypothetical protein
MHDGAPAHFSLFARRYLNRKFPGRWIGRGGPISWPPRSPDLNPVDDVETLRNRIVEGFQTIRNMPGFCDRLLMAMIRRGEASIQEGGGHMEHLL